MSNSHGQSDPFRERRVAHDIIAIHGQDVYPAELLAAARANRRGNKAEETYVAHEPIVLSGGDMYPADLLAAARAGRRNAVRGGDAGPAARAALVLSGNATNGTLGDKYVVTSGQEFTYSAEATDARFAYCYTIDREAAVMLFELKAAGGDRLEGHFIGQFGGAKSVGASEYFVVVATNDDVPALRVPPDWLTIHDVVALQRDARRGENPEGALTIIRAALARVGVTNPAIRVECFRHEP